MADLNPTRELVAALRRIRDTRVEATHDEPPAKDPWINLLHMARLAGWHQAPAIRLDDGTMPADRWVITDDGREWLAQHEQET